MSNRSDIISNSERGTTSTGVPTSEESDVFVFGQDSEEGGTPPVPFWSPEGFSVVPPDSFDGPTTPVESNSTVETINIEELAAKVVRYDSLYSNYEMLERSPTSRKEGFYPGEQLKYMSKPWVTVYSTSSRTDANARFRRDKAQVFETLYSRSEEDIRRIVVAQRELYEKILTDYSKLNPQLMPVDQSTDESFELDLMIDFYIKTHNAQAFINQDERYVYDSSIMAGEKPIRVAVYQGNLIPALLAYDGSTGREQYKNFLKAKYLCFPLFIIIDKVLQGDRNPNELLLCVDTEQAEKRLIMWDFIQRALSSLNTSVSNLEYKIETTAFKNRQDHWKDFEFVLRANASKIANGNEAVNKYLLDYVQSQMPWEWSDILILTATVIGIIGLALTGVGMVAGASVGTAVLCVEIFAGVLDVAGIYLLEQEEAERSADDITALVDESLRVAPDNPDHSLEMCLAIGLLVIGSAAELKALSRVRGVRSTARRELADSAEFRGVGRQESQLDIVDDVRTDRLAQEAQGHSPHMGSRGLPQDGASVYDARATRDRGISDTAHVEPANSNIRTSSPRAMALREFTEFIPSSRFASFDEFLSSNLHRYIFSIPENDFTVASFKELIKFAKDNRIRIDLLVLDRIQSANLQAHVRQLIEDALQRNRTAIARLDSLRSSSRTRRQITDQAKERYDQKEAERIFTRLRRELDEAFANNNIKGAVGERFSIEQIFPDEYMQFSKSNVGLFDAIPTSFSAGDVPKLLSIKTSTAIRTTRNVQGVLNPLPAREVAEQILESMVIRGHFGAEGSGAMKVYSKWAAFLRDMRTGTRNWPAGLAQDLATRNANDVIHHVHTIVKVDAPVSAEYIDEVNRMINEFFSSSNPRIAGSSNATTVKANFQVEVRVDFAQESLTRDLLDNVPRMEQLQTWSREVNDAMMEARRLELEIQALEAVSEAITSEEQ